MVVVIQTAKLVAVTAVQPPPLIVADKQLLVLQIPKLASVAHEVSRQAQGFPYQFNYSYCPPASTGYDDPYVTNLWKSPVHDQMYILYMYDCTQTKPYIDTRPGTLTVAISLFLQGSATNSTKPNK